MSFCCHSRFWTCVPSSQDKAIMANGAMHIPWMSSSTAQNRVELSTLSDPKHQKTNHFAPRSFPVLARLPKPIPSHSQRALKFLHRKAFRYMFVDPGSSITDTTAGRWTLTKPGCAWKRRPALSDECQRTPRNEDHHPSPS